MSDTDIKTIHTNASSNQYADHVFEPHDHAACVSQTVAAAEAKCTHDRARLTETRRKVLDFLLEEHRPLGAYCTKSTSTLSSTFYNLGKLGHEESSLGKLGRVCYNFGRFGQIILDTPRSCAAPRN